MIELRSVRKFIGKYAVWVFCAAMAGIGAILSPSFLSVHNLFNVLRQGVALGFVAIGQAFAIMANCVDLSVGATISLTQCVAAKNMDGQIAGLLPAILQIAAIVLVLGLVNGFSVAKRKGNPFIVTLGTMSVVQGAVLVYTNEDHVGSCPTAFRLFADGYLGPFPLPVIIIAALFLVAHLVLRRTKYGRYVLAVGGNEEVARLSGITTSWVRIATYVLSAAGAALAGLFLAARMNIGDPLVGTGFDIDSVAAVVIGGTDISGGRGTIAGTIGGVLLYALLNNLMNILSVSPFNQIVVKGAIIVLAISLYELGRRS